MHHHRHPLPPPKLRRPGVERALNILAATLTGVVLAMAGVHWLSCEGVC